MLARFLIVLLLLVPGCSSSSQRVKIGSKAFTESVILGELLKLLALQAGVQAEHQARLGDTGKAWNALLLGELDAYCEYTGTLTQELLVKENIQDDAQLRESLNRRGLKMSRPLGFSNNYALGMKEEKANALNIRTLSDLAKHPTLRLGLSNAFLDRADGWKGLKTRYQLPFATPDGMEHTLAYRALESGSIDVLDLYTTDAEILRYNIRVLVDDRKFFPDYATLILYRADLESRAPQVVDAFRSLEGKIDAPTMQRLNSRANIDKLPEPTVAAEYLQTTVRVPSLIERLLWRTWQHSFLVFVSLFAGILTAVPLGILAAKRPVLGQAILALLGMIQTFPALALLSVLILLLARTGSLPAIVALFLYSLLPIVRNTYTALRDIPLPIRESAAALGLGRWERLWLIELPMASRSILGGIKTAAVVNVGFATLGGLIGAGGYGDAIIAGLNRDDSALLMEGAIPAMVMALIVQGLFELAERRLVPAGLRLEPTT
jgi:osmoprotectant transport system permease protein